MCPGHAPAEEEADDQSSSNEAGQGPWDHDCSCNSIINSTIKIDLSSLYAVRVSPIMVRETARK